MRSYPRRPAPRTAARCASRRRGSSLARTSYSSASARSRSYPLVTRKPIVERRKSADSFYLAVAGISVLVRRLWAGLVLDGLVVVWISPSNADHRLAFLAQPLDLGALGVALVVIGVPPSEYDLTRRQVGVDVEVDGSGGTRDPPPALRPGAVAQNEIGRRILPPAVVRSRIAAHVRFTTPPLSGAESSSVQPRIQRQVQRSAR
jgi:hypothetical protein